MSRGRFITLEGGEGAGKSTQSLALSKALRARGLEVVQTREPGGSDGAEDIRALLLNGSEDKWNPRAEALLFAAARSDHVEKLILPSLNRGAWVICDRFIDSSRAYQSQGSGIPEEYIWTLHQIGAQGLLPDRTFMLCVSSSQARDRVLVRDGGDSDRFGARDFSFHDRVNEAFLNIAREDRQRCRIVDADQSPSEVTERLLAELADILP